MGFSAGVVGRETARRPYSMRFIFLIQPGMIVAKEVSAMLPRVRRREWMSIARIPPEVMVRTRDATRTSTRVKARRRRRRRGGREREASGEKSAVAPCLPTDRLSAFVLLVSRDQAGCEGVYGDQVRVRSA